MALFVHLTSEHQAKRIQRNGLTRLRKAGVRPGGVYAMPVTRNFYVSHQWLRELRRCSRQRTLVGVYFRVPDEQEVWVGHYNRAHQKMTAAAAAAVMMAAEDRQGFEVIIPRRIEKGEIQRVRHLPQVLGWRFSPESKGRRPCGCDFCQRGQYNGRKIRERYEARMRTPADGGQS